MKQATQKWTLVGDVMVSYATPGQLDDDMWAQFVNDLKTKPFTKYLSTSRGYVEANSLQRKLAGEAVKSRGIPVAVVTDEQLVRGIVTAIAWLGVNIRAFAWADLEKALSHLNVAPALTQRVTETAFHLRDECEREDRLAKKASAGGK